MKCSVILAVIVAAITTCSAQRLIVCTTKRDDCEQFRENLRCISAASNIDCILKLIQGSADFTSVSVDEADIASKFAKDLVILGDIRAVDRLRNDSDYELAVLVKKEFGNGIKGVKGKTFCHPGFSMSSATPSQLTLFEKAALKANGFESCTSENSTIAEMHIKNVHEIFGESCRPGPWVANSALDKELKQKYSRLVSLCPSEEHGDFKKSLQCLTSGRGEIALTTLGEFYSMFHTNKDRENYKFICEDGSLAAHDLPCPWQSKPWPLLLGRRDTFRQSLDIIKQFMSDYIHNPASPFVPRSGISTSSLLPGIILGEDINNKRLVLYNNETSFTDFMARNKRIINSEDLKTCTDMKWCVINDAEHAKCEWLSQAAAYQGIQPSISCVKSEDILSCLKDIEHETADVVDIDGLAYVVYKRALKGISFPDTPEEYVTRYITVIKNNTEDIKSFKDLKGKRGCFAEYGDNGWTAFVNNLRGQDILDHDTCNYGQLLSNFLDNSCMPGAIDKDYHTTDLSPQSSEKLCSLCVPPPHGTATTCNANANDNTYYGNNGALTCLENSGDFAVIGLTEITKTNFENFKILCRSGDIIPFSTTVTNDCALTSVTDSLVVVKRSHERIRDFELAIEEIASKFTYNPPFKVFKEFNSTKDLLFPDKTSGLSTRDSGNPYIQNYLNLFRHAEECSVHRSMSNSAEIPKILLLICSFIFVLQQY